MKHRLAMYLWLAVVTTGCATSQAPGVVGDLDAAGDAAASDAATDTTHGPADGGGDGAPRDSSITDVKDAADTHDAAPTVLRIEEVYVDRNASGNAVELVELTGPAGLPLGTIHLRFVDSTGKVTGDVEISGATATMPAVGRWVVGGLDVKTIFPAAVVDTNIGGAAWGLDDAAGSVQLVDTSTTKLLDVLGYGAAIPAPTTDPTTTSEGSPKTPLPTDVGHTLGRRAGATDTGSNAADFCEQVGTPGAVNGACL